ncbi:MAG: M48 family metalloprotease [Blastocatellia bacterium]|nr:M48 family metalloprotease [Blastocatellia bacterium]
MKIKLKNVSIAFIISVTLAVSSPVLGQKKDHHKKRPLKDKDNPTLIGKRDINKGQLAFYSYEKEVALGRQLSKEVDRSSRFVTDPVVNEYVNRVGQNLVLHSDAKLPFTIKVVDSNEINAFALPGGFLYVNRGLLEAADNEAEVAGVLSHEIAHVAARHGIEQASKSELLRYGSLPLIFFGGIGGYIVQQVASFALPLTYLKFSRGAEKEADRLGAQYMWASGYDPTALISFFEKLQTQEKAKQSTLLRVFSTHPLTGDRIIEVRDLISRFPDRNEYQISSSEFSMVKLRLVTANAARAIPAAAGDVNGGRPTLRRRPDSGDDAGEPADNNNRPVLKRTDDSTATKTDEKAGNSSDTSARPELKRPPESPNNH